MSIGTTKRQQTFRAMVTGTLVYAVVLGFFNDYTDLVSTRSFSSTFFAAAVLQLLTLIVLTLKGLVLRRMRSRDRHIALRVLFVWLIIFLSKFVFLAIIDFIFGDAVDIRGIVGLALVVISVTAIQAAIDWIDPRLGVPVTGDTASP